MRLCIFISSALLASCQQAPNDTQPPNDPFATAAAPLPVETNDAAPPPPHMSSDPQLPVPEEKSTLGAARRLLEYCDAVATRRYADAYRYWDDEGRSSGMTLEQFVASFAKYAAYDCHIGAPGDPEGAAGSVYVTIPLQVTGMLARGGGFRLEGAVTMRRVNDVDGSTTEQRRWHLDSSALKP